MLFKIELSKIFFLISVIGIIFLLFLSQNLEPKKIKINDITKKNLEEKVSVDVSVQKIKYLPNSIIITPQNSNITIIIFTKKILNLKENQTIKVNGKIEIYKGNLQIIADKIELILN